MINYISLKLLAAADCPATFFGLPTWHRYLQHESVAGDQCLARVSGLNDILLVLAAVIEMLLRISALVAITFVLIGGIKFITANGQPDKIAQARGTAINGIVGLVIAIAATAAVTFVAGKFH